MSNTTNDSIQSALRAGLHARGYLPHLKRENGTYFVTFRLYGTLPRELLRTLKQERENILRFAMTTKRPMTYPEELELFEWYANRVDTILDDARHGDAWLKEPAIADLVASALRHFRGQRYELHAFVIMPNHVHVVVRPSGPHTLSTILHSWKSFTAHEANRILNRQGKRFWQKESFDHLCRDDDDTRRCTRYTLNNPVKARLCAIRENWPGSSAFGALP